jgi:hypothetical protein
MYPLQRIRQRHIRKKLHRLDTIRILGKGLRDQPIEELQHVWLRSRVLRPVQICAAVRIEVADEADEIGRHILSPVDVKDVGTVELEVFTRWKSGRVLAGKVRSKLTEPRKGTVLKRLFTRNNHGDQPLRSGYPTNIPYVHKACFPDRFCKKSRLGAWKITSL